MEENVMADFTDLLSCSMFLPFGSMQNMDKSLTENEAYHKILGSMRDLILEGFRAELTVIKCNEMDMEKLFKAFKAVCDNIMDSMADIPGVPSFMGMEDIRLTAMKPFASFPDAQRITGEFLEELFDFNSEIRTVWASAMKPSAKIYRDMRESGDISLDIYRQMAEVCAETSKHFVGLMGFPSAFQQGYNDIVDDTANLAEKNLDVFVSALEIPLKLNQAAAKSGQEIFSSAWNAFMEGKIADEIFIISGKTCEKAMHKYMKHSQVSVSIPKFINSWRDFTRAANENFQKAMGLS